MKYDGKSSFSTEFFVVFGKGFQGILDTGKHQGIDCCLIFPGKIPDLFGEGKGDQIVLGRQPLAQLILGPLLVFMVLAMGTVPVATGMWNIDLFSAVVIGTLCQHVRTVPLSALHHGLQGLFMAWQDIFLVSIKKAILEFVDDRGEQNHLTPPHVMSKVLASVLTAWRALFLVLDVRWVYLEVVRTLTWPRIFCNSMRSTPASSICVA
jgi:hypothetical protein